MRSPCIHSRRSPTSYFLLPTCYFLLPTCVVLASTHSDVSACLSYVCGSRRPLTDLLTHLPTYSLTHLPTCLLACLWEQTAAGYALAGSLSFGLLEVFSRAINDLAGPGNALFFSTPLLALSSAMATAVCATAVCPFEAVRILAVRSGGCTRPRIHASVHPRIHASTHPRIHACT